MKPILEIAPFMAVAVVAHIGAFALVAEGGVSAGGDGGAGQITLEGGDPGIEAMIAAWERPPLLAAPLDPVGHAAAHDTGMETLPQLHPSEAPVLPALQALTPMATLADNLPPPAPPAPPLAMMPMPEPIQALPDRAPSVDRMPPAPILATPALAGLTEQPVLISEMPRSPSADLPDTTPPPPSLLAQAPESSPHPPARPTPRQAQQANRPQSSASAAPAQRASGSGAQGHEGQAGQARQTSRVEVDTGGLVAQWGGAVRAAVQRQQRHPAGTRDGGTVLLRLDVHSDGRLLGVALRHSSGHAALDQAALDAVRRARIPAAPQGLSGAFQFNLPVRFRG